MRGDFDLARERIARSIALSEEFNHLSLLSSVYERPNVEILAGDYATAEQMLRSAEEEVDEYQEWWGMRFAHRASLAATLCAQQKFEEAANLTDVLPTNPGDWVVPHTVWRSARAQALARLGRPDEAITLAHDAVERSELTDDLNLRGAALHAQSDVLHACGHHADAVRSRDAAIDIYTRKGNLMMATRVTELAETGRP